MMRFQRWPEILKVSAGDEIEFASNNGDIVIKKAR